MTYIKIMIKEQEPLPAAYLMGDVNSDGKVTESDAVMLQKYLLANGPVTNWPQGDMDKNGRLNAADLTLMKRKLTV